MTSEQLADVTALLRMAHERLTDLETRSPGRLYMSQADILARIERLERTASTEGMQHQGEPADSPALVERLEGIEAQLTVLAELQAAPPAARELPEHQGEHQGPELAELLARVERLEAADTTRRRRDLRLRARNDARAADALRRRKAVARIMDTLRPPHGWEYPTATAVHAVLADASAHVGEKPLALRTVRWHMAAVAAERVRKQRRTEARGSTD
jgi:hypothetical protein